MSCQNTNTECKQNNQCNQCSQSNNDRGYGYNGFVCIVVLYILLAIIISSFVY